MKILCIYILEMIQQHLGNNFVKKGCGYTSHAIIISMSTCEREFFLMLRNYRRGMRKLMSECVSVLWVSEVRTLLCGFCAN